MKKTLLLGLLLATGLTAKAQIADGSAAPDFSGTDVVSGAEVSLQAYLDQGKTVLVYMSAAWCGPCWSFHNTHYLSDIHNAFGVEGSDEVVVIYIESDWRTPEGEIFGTDLPQSLPAGVPAPPAPLGDWTLDTPYIIINNDNVAEDYDIPGFPTMFAICPQGEGQPGIVTEIERGTPADLTASLEGACDNTLVGIDHWARVTAGDIRSCEAEGGIYANVEGYGHDLTSVEAQLLKDGSVVATETFELELEGFEVGTITFENQVFDAEADYAVTITQVNGAAALTTFPEFNTSDNFNVFPEASVDSYQNLKITVHTDEWPGEMKAYIINSSGDVVWNSPNYTAAHKEQTFVYWITLDETDCYDIAMTDAYGDGWTYNQTGAAVPHGMQIESGEDIIWQHDGNFGQLVYNQATFKTNGLLEAEKFENEGFAVYPNPSAGIFNFTTQQVLDVTVLDITGKVVHTQAGIANGGTMDLGKLQAGMYIAKIKAENGAERIEKLVIK